MVRHYGSKLVEQALASEKVQAISIALVDDQQVIWSQGFGYADVLAKRPATGDTVYRVGSISKLFTDTAALQLVERGKLNLDEPVQRLLPGFSPKSWDGSGTEITSRMLMTHHSGLQRDSAKSFQSKTPERFTHLASNFTSYLAYPPGQLLSYSNIGLTVLGSVVEKLSGHPFEAQLKQEVLEPLGMTQSDFSTSASFTAGMAQSYDSAEVRPAVPLRDVPAGGLNSTVNDLSRFMQMIFAGGRSNGQQVLKAETVAEMFQPQNTNVKLDFDNTMGLGWFLQLPDKSRISGGGLLAEHGGAIDGYRSELMMLPGHKLGVVVLSNSASGAEAVNDIALEVLKLALEAKTGLHASGTPSDGARFVEHPLAPALIDQWVGNYATTMGYIRVYSKDGKSLQVDALGHTVMLREREDGLWGLSYKLMGIVPVSLGNLGTIGLSRQTVDGRELLIAHQGPRQALAGERIRALPVDGNSRQFAEQHLGHYEVTDAGDGKLEIHGVRFLEENGVLIAEVKVADSDQMARVAVKPVTGNLALALGPLADRGEVVEALSSNSGSVEVRALGLTFRKLVPPGP